MHVDRDGMKDILLDKQSILYLLPEANNKNLMGQANQVHNRQQRLL